MQNYEKLLGQRNKQIVIFDTYMCYLDKEIAEKVR
jgi:hypothetical protein